MSVGKISASNVNLWNFASSMLEQRQGPARCPSTVSGACTRSARHLGLQTLARAARGARGSRVALQRALRKMKRGIEALGAGTAELMVRVLAEQNKHTDDRLSRARGAVADKFAKLQRQTKVEIEHIKKRIEAERSSCFWDFFAKIFKVVATALSAAASAVSGGLGAIAAGLMITSLAVSQISGKAAHWIGLGLGLAGAAVGLAGVSAGSSLLSEAATSKISVVLSVGSGGARGVAAVGTLVKGQVDGAALDAQAELLELRALRAQLLAEAEQQRKEMTALIEAQGRIADLVFRGLTNADQVAHAAHRS